MISAQIESFARAIPELERIFPVHHAELALYQNRMPMVWQYAEYIQAENEGKLVLATVRLDSRIVAYYLCDIGFPRHFASTRAAIMDGIYVHPDYRGRGLILPLMRCIEKELRRRRIDIWYSSYKTDKALKLDRVYREFGFTPSDTVVVKWIGGK